VILDESIPDSINKCEGKKFVLDDYIRSQNMSMTKEVVAPSLREIKTDKKLFDTNKIKYCLDDLKKIKTKHEQEGIMRRNKLLIEHIVYQRIKDKWCILNAFSVQGQVQ